MSRHPKPKPKNNFNIIHFTRSALARYTRYVVSAGARIAHFHELYRQQMYPGRDDEGLRVARELERAESSGSSALALGGLRLHALPPAVAQAAALTAPGGLATRLRRLDLSSNCISELPPSIGLLTNLRELWLQNNPLGAIPADIASCAKLETLDIRRTRVDDIPPVISTMKCLTTLDWSGTPFAERARGSFRVEVHDLAGLRATLKLVFERQNLDAQLSEYLLSQHYAQETDDPHNVETIINFAKVVHLI